MKMFNIGLLTAGIMSALGFSGHATTSAEARTSSAITPTVELPADKALNPVAGKVRVDDFIAIQTLRILPDDFKTLKITKGVVNEADAERVAAKYVRIPADINMMPLGKRYIDQHNLIPDRVQFMTQAVKVTRVHALTDNQQTDAVIDGEKNGISQQNRKGAMFEYTVRLNHEPKSHMEKVELKMAVRAASNGQEIARNLYDFTGYTKSTIVKKDGKIVPFNGSVWFAGQAAGGPILVGVTPGTGYVQADLSAINKAAK